MNIGFSLFASVLFETDKARFYRIGAIVVVVAILALIFGWCIQVARRPSANGKGVISLAIAFSAWLMTVAIATGIQESVPKKAVTVFSIAFMGTLAPLAGILATWGLLEIRRKPETFTQGKGYAVTALILSVPMAVLVVLSTLKILRSA